MKRLCLVSSAFATTLAVLSGVMLAHALPPRNINALGWIAFLPLLASACIDHRWMMAAFYGLLTGAVTAWTLAGHSLTAAQFGNLFGAFGSLAIAFALVAGLASYGWRRLHPVLWPFYVACAAVTAELLSVFAFPVSVAISQHQNLSALRIASYTGIWGVSFLLWLFPAFVIALLARRRVVWPAFAVVAAVVCVANLLPPEAFPVRNKRIAVAAIQAPDNDTAAELTQQVLPVAAVVWPELLGREDDRTARDAASTNCVYVVASVKQSNGDEKPYNAALLVSPRGEGIGTARKTHLFGRECMMYKRGSVGSAVPCDGFRAAMAICFDTEFTDITRSLVGSGADVIFVPNCDPEMPGFIFHHLHSAVIPFRAAENGVPIVWAEAHGLSAIFDGSGRCIDRAPTGSIGFARGTVALGGAGTLFTLMGDYFAYLCAMTLVAATSIAAISTRTCLPKRYVSLVGGK